MCIRVFGRMAWLRFSISPFELPLKSGVFIAKPRPFEGGFGVLMIVYLTDGDCLF